MKASEVCLGEIIKWVRIGGRSLLIMPRLSSLIFLPVSTSNVPEV
jgi:hypothetical protein